MRIYVNNKNGEFNFERDFAEFVTLSKGYYFKIKDPVITRKNNREKYLDIFPEVKRGFDGILFLPNGVLMVELKYNKNQPSSDQIETAYKINSVVKRHYFLRKTVMIENNNIKVCYTIEELILDSVIYGKNKNNKFVPIKWKLETVSFSVSLEEMMNVLVKILSGN